MQAWQAFMTPGDIHKMIAKGNGTWKTETQMWMEPGSAPTKSSGSCVNSMVLGGRYQQSKFSGNFMNMPFEGIGTLAYDNAKKTFVSTWIDNMGTGIMSLEGQWDDATKTINFNGKCTDPMTGKDCQVREAFTIVDDNHHHMEMWMTDPASGQEYKTMEISFTRAAKKS